MGIVAKLPKEKFEEIQMKIFIKYWAIYLLYFIILSKTQSSITSYMLKNGQETFTINLLFIKLNIKLNSAFERPWISKNKNDLLIDHKSPDGAVKWTFMNF